MSLAAAAWGSTRDQWHVQGNASRGQDHEEWPKGAGGGHDKPDASSAPSPLGVSVADQQALQAGIALARQQLGSAALSDVCRGEAAKALALQFDVGRLAPLGNQIGNLISADLQRIQQITAGFNAIRAMHPLLQAEEERRQRLAEIINPCRGLMEGLRIQSSGLDRVAESYQASWRRMAEAVVPRFPAIECGLGLDAISTIAPFGELGLADLQGPMRIHAVPRLAFPAKHRQARRHDQPSPPEQLQAGPTIDLTGEDSRKLLKQLLPFLRSDEIPGKTRESMRALIDWWQLNQQGITPDQSVKFNRIVLNLIPMPRWDWHHPRVNSGNSAVASWSPWPATQRHPPISPPRYSPQRS